VGWGWVGWVHLYEAKKKKINGRLKVSLAGEFLNPPATVAGGRKS